MLIESVSFLVFSLIFLFARQAQGTFNQLFGPTINTFVGQACKTQRPSRDV